MVLFNTIITTKYFRACEVLLHYEFYFHCITYFHTSDQRPAVLQILHSAFHKVL